MANIIVLGVKVPFVRGGQEVLVNTLVRELSARGHTVDLVELPFTLSKKEDLLKQIVLWRSLDLSSFCGKDVDLVIATKFPSYFVRHSRKSLWLVHQHRPIYDLFGGNFTDFGDDPRDEAIREMIVDADTKAISSFDYISGISANVIERLKNYNGINGSALYPPLPLGNNYRCAPAEPYILSVGRLNGIKRVDLLIKSMPAVRDHLKLKVVGTPEEPGIMEYYRGEIDKHHLWDTVEFLGRVSDQELIELYAKSAAVYYAPHNEDYGYVTLEGMASSKPILSATDSGGVLEFVRDRENGLVVAPTIDGISAGLREFVDSPESAKSMGLAGRKFIESSGLLDSGWEAVTKGLLSPLGVSHG